MRGHARAARRRAVGGDKVSPDAPLQTGLLCPISGGASGSTRTLVNVRFAPKATEVLRCRKASLCASNGHPVNNNNVVRMSFVLVSVFGVATPVG